MLKLKFLEWQLRDWHVYRCVTINHKLFNCTHFTRVIRTSLLRWFCMTKTIKTITFITMTCTRLWQIIISVMHRWTFAHKEISQLRTTELEVGTWLQIYQWRLFCITITLEDSLDIKKSNRNTNSHKVSPNIQRFMRQYIPTSKMTPHVTRSCFS